MSKLIDPLLRVTFVVGVVGALAVGGQAAFASAGATSCFCDPDDPDPDQDCVDCYMAAGSICPWGTIRGCASAAEACTEQLTPCAGTAFSAELAPGQQERP